jgi:hypothetical protein
MTKKSFGLVPIAAAITALLASIIADAEEPSPVPPATPPPIITILPTTIEAPPPPPTPLPTVPELPPIQGPRPLPTAPPTARSLIEFGPAATVVLPASAASVVSYSINGIFQLVNIPQDQIVQVVVQYPTSQAAEVVRVEALDGGLLVAGASATVGGYSVGGYTATVPRKRVDSGTISADGSFTFIFQAGHPPGLYQIRINRGTEVLGLQFWISDPQHSANNPPGLAPRTPQVPNPNPI